MSSIPASGIVTLLTDFGLSDPFVGVMHGVLLTCFPEARIVDLTHGIPPQDLGAAAFWLEESFREFPEGTVHVAVVDPGVGTARRELAAEASRHFFVGPDNGLLAPILARARHPEVRAVDRARLGLERVSATFHGRDVFSPVAAELASGRRWLSEIGPLVEDWIPSPVPVPSGGEGRVIVVDRFGNLITDLGLEQLAGLTEPVLELGGVAYPVRRTYGEVPIGAPVALMGSFRRLELAVRDGHAARVLGHGVGTPVRVRSG